jgi:hypothetical protein
MTQEIKALKRDSPISIIRMAFGLVKAIISAPKYALEISR